MIKELRRSKKKKTTTAIEIEIIISKHDHHPRVQLEVAQEDAYMGSQENQSGTELQSRWQDAYARCVQHTLRADRSWSSDEL